MTLKRLRFKDLKKGMRVVAIYADEYEVKIENLTAYTNAKAFIYNNTTYKCRRGIYFSNPTYFSSPLSADCINNICQKSEYQDFVCDYFNSSFFLMSNNISKDYSAGLFSGTLNYKNTAIDFANPDNGNFYLGRTDYPAIDTADDLSENDLYYFNDDNTDMTRDYQRWDRGAFETVNVSGTGELVVTPVTMECSCSVLDTAPTLVLHIRRDVNNLLSDVPESHQFFAISDAGGTTTTTTTTSEPVHISLNSFLNENPCYDSYNLEINVQGGLTVPVGEFILRNRGTSLSVIIQTYPPELRDNTDGVATLIYPEAGIVDLSSLQKTLTLQNIKIFSVDNTVNSYLIDPESVTPYMKFVNCIVQLNLDAIVAKTNSAELDVEAINTTFIYSNNTNETTLYLVKNSNPNVSQIYNSEIITDSNNDISFSTTMTQTNDRLSNVLTYNYSDGRSLTINNLVKPNCLENTDPIFDMTDFSNCRPKLNSPVFDAGNNSYVSEIAKDVIGNNRIFNNRTVDIGPYELQVHSLTFKSTDIEAIYQDKLTLMESNYFKGTYLS